MRSLESKLDGTRKQRGPSFLSGMRAQKNAQNWLRAGIAAAALLGCVGDSRSAIGESAPDGGQPTHLDSGSTDAHDDEAEDAGPDTISGGDGGDGGDGGNSPGACPSNCSPSAADTDGDCLLDENDLCPDSFDSIDPATCQAFNTDGDDKSNACDPCPSNPTDNGLDTDGDGRGDVCDGAPGVADDGSDTDSDSVPNVIDNCDRPNALQVDTDGDGSGIPCDCDDGDDSVLPGAFDASCDGVDSDCDGEGRLIATSATGRSTISGEPECECLPGTVRVIGPTAGPCVGLEEECVFTTDASGEVAGSEFQATNEDEVVEPGAEACEASGPPIDEDCDGLVNEGLACPVPCVVDSACGTDTGPCVAGVQDCIGGVLSSVCAGAVGPAASDPCDNVDNNCDGDVDDLYETGEDCVGTIGECAGKPGRFQCVTTSSRMCSADDPASPDFGGRTEICDGFDNDCDREVDEVAFGVVGGTAGQTAIAGTPCPAVGVCDASTYICSGPNAVVCGNLADSDRMPDVGGREAACDDGDTDCDGIVDEGCECDIDDTRACGSNTGECSEGTQTCVDGAWPAACVGGVVATSETCDGQDDNCDGRVDDFADGVRGQPCTIDVAGTLTAGTYNCIDGEDEVFCDTTP